MLKTLGSIGKRGFWVAILAWILIIYYVKSMFGFYSADSYAFYFLGKNLVAGHGYTTSAIRDFYLDPNGPFLSRSYPPLFPLLLGITDFFLNQGIAAGRVTNLFVCLFAVYVWFTISKRLSGSLFFIPFLIPIIYSLLPFDQPLWRDAIAARSSSLTWLLFLMILSLLLRPSLFTNNRTSIGIGIILALLPLTRFDTLIFCVALPFIIYCTTKLPFKKMLLIYVAFIVVSAPWAIRNFIVFGTLFSSSESITVASTLSGIVPLQFYENGVPLGINNPYLWVMQRFFYLKFNTLYSLSLLSPFYNDSGKLTLAAGIIIFLFLFGFIFSFVRRKEHPALWIYFITTLAWFIFSVGSISLTPHGHETRYYVVACFAIIGGVALFITTLIQKILVSKFKNICSSEMERTSITTTAVELLILVVLGFLTIHTYSKAIYSNEQDAFWSWASDINKTPVKKGERVAAIQAEKIAYYTGWDTIYLPANIPSLKDTSNYGDNQQAWRNYRAWLKHWKPSYLIVRLFDFSNPLAEYPHASVSTILDSSLDPVVLLKINLDESALTEEDAAHDAKMRDLWKQHIHARIPAREGVFANILNYVKGVSPPCGCFFVPNTPENQAKFSTGRVVLLPNGEQRVIRESYFNDWRLFVKVHGGAFTNSFPDLPDTLETIDGDPIPAFFITNDQWVRGVARQWAGFYVEDNPQNQQKYKAGYTVELPTKEERTITKTVNEPGVIKIYLSGNPLDGYKTGTPDYFKVRSK